MLIGTNDLGSPYRSGYSVLANRVAFSYHPIAATFDWSTIGAVGGVNAVFTTAVSGGAGTFTIAVTQGGSTQTTAGLAYNAALDTIEAAVEALSNVGNGNVRVSGTPGTSYVFEFVEGLRHQPIGGVVTVGSGGATATTTVTTTGTVDGPQTLASGYVAAVGDKVLPAGSVIYKITPGSITSKWGLALTATSLVRGETLVVDHDVVMSIDLNQIGPVFDNGNVITARLLVGGAGQPTLANLLTACPALRPFQ